MSGYVGEHKGQTPVRKRDVVEEVTAAVRGRMASPRNIETGQVRLRRREQMLLYAVRRLDVLHQLPLMRHIEGHADCANHFSASRTERYDVRSIPPASPAELGRPSLASQSGEVHAAVYRRIGCRLG